MTVLAARPARTAAPRAFIGARRPRDRFLADPAGAGLSAPRGRQAPLPHRQPAPVGQLRIKQHPSSLSHHMTLPVPRPDRTLTPHTYAVPVVREAPLLLPAAGSLLLRLVALIPPPAAPSSSSLRAAGSV